MNILLHVIYDVLKALVLLVLRIFFRKIRFINRKNLRYEYPCILVSNHPNTLLDPLIPSAFARRKVFFLANASLFAGAFANWFFSTFYCIPVYRPQDKGYKPGKNNNSFEKAENHLIGGGTLYIAPEGTSYIERRLRPIKTGTARIALQTAARQNFETNLKILPVGLNYEDQTRFWKNILVNTGEPISLNGYREEYQTDTFEAVLKLTEELQERMGELLISIQDVTESRLFRTWESIISNHQKLSPEEQFFISKKQLEKLEAQASYKKDFYQRLRRYHILLKGKRLSDSAFEKQSSFWWIILLQLLFFPLALGGILINILPALVLRFLDHLLRGLYIGYRSAWLVMGGLLFIPLFYTFENWMLNKFLPYDNSWLLFTAAGLLGLVFSREWLDRQKLMMQIVRIRWGRKSFGKAIRQMQELRATFLSQDT